MDIRQLDNLANLIRLYAQHMPHRHGAENTGYDVNIAYQLELSVLRERQHLTDHADRLSQAARVHHADHLSCTLAERTLEPTGT